MRSKIALLTVAILLTAVRVLALPLPDSCGEGKVKFEVKTEKGQPPPSAPEQGKAQIIFIENENSAVGIWGVVPKYATIRFGLDGAWVGADNGSSYFVRAVDPGVHHVCASWQSTMKRLKRDVDVTSFTAEPGHTYYFQAEVNVESEFAASFALSELNKDKGQYLVKNFRLSTPKPR